MGKNDVIIGCESEEKAWLIKLGARDDTISTGQILDTEQDQKGTVQ